jgi:hypothetical protein
MGDRGGSVDVVQRSGPLRNRDRERGARRGTDGETAKGNAVQKPADLDLPDNGR